MKRIVISIALCFAILFAASFSLNETAHNNWNKDHIWLMQTLLPASEEFTRIPYDGEDANIRDIHKGENGFVIQTATYGYAGEITMLIGVNNDGKVVGLMVRSMHETFGLGAQALTDHVFLSQFLNTAGGVAIGSPDAEADAFSGATATETETETSVYVDGISGATVTSKAIARCVNSAVAYVTGADIDSGATSWGG